MQKLGLDKDEKHFLKKVLLKLVAESDEDSVDIRVCICFFYHCNCKLQLFIS